MLLLAAGNLIKDGNIQLLVHVDKLGALGLVLSHLLLVLLVGDLSAFLLSLKFLLRVRDLVCFLFLGPQV